MVIISKMAPNIYTTVLLYYAFFFYILFCNITTLNKPLFYTAFFLYNYVRDIKKYSFLIEYFMN